MRAIRRFTVRTVLPDALAPLATSRPTCAGRGTRRRRTCSPASTPELWDEVGQDPVGLLGEVGPHRWAELAADEDFVGHVRWIADDLRAYLTGERWYQSLGDGRAALDRLLLARVRHHRGAAAVLRRSRHPRRRPPQGGQRPRCADHRRRPVLPRRLLPPVDLARRLAAGDLPGARPRRPAARRCCASPTARRWSSRSASPADVRCAPTSGVPTSAACRCCCSTPTSRERRRRARRHRPALRRRRRAPAAAGAAARHRRRARPARVQPHHRGARARGVPHQRGSRRVPRPRAHPRARAVARA